jgi:hypothetical protein
MGVFKSQSVGSLEKPDLSVKRQKPGPSGGRSGQPPAVEGQADQQPFDFNFR